MDNPLYDEWQRMYAGAKLDHGMWIWPGSVEQRCNRFLEDMKYRKKLQHQFAWAVPSPDAIERLVKLSPIVEIGAGRGYWAALLQDAGADVIAYDAAPPDRAENDWAPESNEHGTYETEVFTEILEGGPEKVLDHQDRSLFLCWPPHDERMAYDCLRQYKGDTVIYVGEPAGGCTADEMFDQLLASRFEEIEDITIPFWDGLHDYLSIHTRKHR